MSLSKWKNALMNGNDVSLPNGQVEIFTFF